MRHITTLGNEPIQTHTILFGDNEITLVIRFLPPVAIWIMDITFNDDSIYGVKMSVGSLHVFGQNWPFDFAVTDESGAGIDPFQLDDFTSGRCNLYLFEPNEVEQIRGVPVEIP